MLTALYNNITFIITSQRPAQLGTISETVAETLNYPTVCLEAYMACPPFFHTDSKMSVYLSISWSLQTQTMFVPSPTAEPGSSRQL